MLSVMLYTQRWGKLTVAISHFVWDQPKGRRTREISETVACDGLVKQKAYRSVCAVSRSQDAAFSKGGRKLPERSTGLSSPQSHEP